MPSDSPIVEEVRRRRGELSKRFEDDVYKYGRHLMEYQQRFQDRLVSQITVVPAREAGATPAGGREPQKP